MKKALIVDVVPIQVQGETVYIETPRGIGAAPSSSFVTATANISTAVNTANAIADTIPQKVTVQSDFSKVANTVAVGASAVAAVGVVFPPVAIVAGIVAAAAALLGKVFANSKAKAYSAERGQYDLANAELKYENQQLDQQYLQTADAINQMKVALSSLSGIPSDAPGLGLCLWNCKDEKGKLNDAKAEFELLQKEQESKTKMMADLLTEYNKLMKGFLELQGDKKTKDYLLYVLMASVVIGTVWYAVKSK